MSSFWGLLFRLVLVGSVLNQQLAFATPVVELGTLQGNDCTWGVKVSYPNTSTTLIINECYRLQKPRLQWTKVDNLTDLYQKVFVSKNSSLSFIPFPNNETLIKASSGFPMSLHVESKEEHCYPFIEGSFDLQGDVHVHTTSDSLEQWLGFGQNFKASHLIFKNPDMALHNYGNLFIECLSPSRLVWLTNEGNITVKGNEKCPQMEVDDLQNDGAIHFLQPWGLSFGAPLKQKMQNVTLSLDQQAKNLVLEGSCWDSQKKYRPCKSPVFLPYYMPFETLEALPIFRQPSLFKFIALRHFLPTIHQWVVKDIEGSGEINFEEDAYIDIKDLSSFPWHSFKGAKDGFISFQDYSRYYVLNSMNPFFTFKDGLFITSPHIFQNGPLQTQNLWLFAQAGSYGRANSQATTLSLNHSITANNFGAFATNIEFGPKDGPLTLMDIRGSLVGMAAYMDIHQASVRVEGHASLLVSFRTEDQVFGHLKIGKSFIKQKVKKSEPSRNQNDQCKDKNKPKVWEIHDTPRRNFFLDNDVYREKSDVTSWDVYGKSPTSLSVGGELNIKAESYEQYGDVFSGGDLRIQTHAHNPRYPWEGRLEINAGSLLSLSSITLSGNKALVVTRPASVRHFYHQDSWCCGTCWSFNDYETGPASIIQAQGNVDITFPQVSVYGSSILSAEGQINIQANQKYMRDHVLRDGRFCHCIASGCSPGFGGSTNIQPALIQGKKVAIQTNALEQKGFILAHDIDIKGNDLQWAGTYYNLQASAPAVAINIREFLYKQSHGFLKISPDGSVSFAVPVKQEKPVVWNKLPYMGVPCDNPYSTVSPSVLSVFMPQIMARHGMATHGGMFYGLNHLSPHDAKGLVEKSFSLGPVAFVQDYPYPVLLAAYGSNDEHPCFVDPFIYFPQKTPSSIELTPGSMLAVNDVNVGSTGPCDFKGQAIVSLEGNIHVDCTGGITRTAGVESISYIQGGHSVTEEKVTPQQMVAKEGTITMITDGDYTSTGSQTLAGKGITIMAGGALKAMGHISTLKEIYCWKKKGGWLRSDEEGCQEHIKKQIHPDVYVAREGSITKVSQGHLLQLGTTDQAESVLFDASKITLGALTALEAYHQHISKEWAFKSSYSATSGQSLKSQAASLEAQNITLVGDVGRLEGVHIEAGILNNRVTDLTIGTSPKQELCWSHSHEKAGVLGESGRIKEGCRQEVIPSLVILEKFEDEAGGKVVFEGVQAWINALTLKSDFEQLSIILKSWQKEKSWKTGFFVPAIDNDGKPPVVSALEGAKEAEHAMDKAAAYTRLATQVLQDARIGFAFWKGSKLKMGGKDFNPLTALLSQYTTLGIERQKSRSLMENEEALRNTLTAETLDISNGLTVLRGSGTIGRATITTDEFRVESDAVTSRYESQQERQAATFNLLTNGIGVEGSSSSLKQESTKNLPSVFKIEELYLRAGDVLIKGSQVMAKVVDAIISGNLKIQSLLDVFKLTQESMGGSISYGGGTDGGFGLPDLRLEDRDKLDLWIAHVAGMIGTQKFLMTVGKQLSLVSGDIGLRPDGLIVKPEEAEQLKAHLASANGNTGTSVLDTGAGMGVQRISAEDIQVELLQEVHEDDHTVINAFLGSAQSLLDTAKALHSEVKTQQFKEQYQAEQTAQFEERAKEWLKAEAEDNTILTSTMPEKDDIVAYLKGVAWHLKDEGFASAYTLAQEEALAQEMAQQYLKVANHLKLQGADDEELMGHFRLMKASYEEQVKSLQPKIVLAAFPALAVMVNSAALVSSVVWNVYHDLQENPESSREAVYQKVALKLDADPETVKSIIENADTIIGLIPALGGMVKKAVTYTAAKTVQRIHRVVNNKELPQDKLNAATQKAQEEAQLPSYDTPYAGGHIRSFVTEKEETYYRVYSKDKEGSFLTKIPPKNREFAQEGMALPEENTAEFIQEVIVPKGVKLERSRALPAFEKRGGLEQFRIVEREDIKRVTFKDGRPL